MDANQQAAQETSSSAVVIPSDEKSYAEWRQTGKLPEAKAKPATDGNAKPVKADSDSDGDEPTGQKSAPDSETGNENKGKIKTRSNAQIRLDEILEDLKKANLSPSELKNFKRELKAEQVKAAPEQTEKPPERPKRPKRADYYDQDDPDTAYETAMDDYESKVREFDRQETIREFKRTQAEEHTREELHAQLSDAKTRYGEEASKTIFETCALIVDDPAIPGAIKAIINNSPVLVDLMHVIGSKPDELKAFIELAKTDPGQAIRQAVLTERLVMNELEKASKGNVKQKEDEQVEEPEASQRDESGKFIPKKVTKAPPPPEEVGGSKGAPPDEVDSAFKAKDFASYRAAQNRKDLAKAKGL
jgi:hypothetical protein